MTYNNELTNFFKNQLNKTITNNTKNLSSVTLSIEFVTSSIPSRFDSIKSFKSLPSFTNSSNLIAPLEKLNLAESNNRTTNIWKEIKPQLYIYLMSFNIIDYNEDIKLQTMRSREQQAFNCLFCPENITVSD